MTHVDRSGFSNEDYRSIRRFTTMLNDTGIGAAILDYELGTHKNIAGDSLEPIRACLGDVLGTEPEDMHESGFSFAEVFVTVQKMDVVPEDFLPSEELVERLQVQFWNYQRDLAEEAEPKVTARDGIRPAHLA